MPWPMADLCNKAEQEKDRYREKFGINEDEFEIIQSAIPKRDYIIKQPGITKLVVSTMPELTLASNDACAVEKQRNIAFDKANEGAINWTKSYIKEVMHVSV